MRPPSIESAADVYRVGSEIYHLQYARRTHGDDAVLSELKAHFQAQGDAPSDAYIHAGQTLKTVDALITASFGCKAMRARLDMAADSATNAPILAAA